MHNLIMPSILFVVVVDVSCLFVPCLMEFWKLLLLCDRKQTISTLQTFSPSHPILQEKGMGQTEQHPQTAEPEAFTLQDSSTQGLLK